MSDPADTPLMREIRARLDARGPMSVAEYMDLALAHPVHGYYATRDPLGRAGDFTTAPEISQMFGEMIGLWLAERRSACPEGAILAEAGPGRGTLMADARRAAPSLSALPLWLVETSPRLREEQARRLPDARFADRLADLPRAPLVLVANEFLDALPVRQYLSDESGWHEVLVGRGADGGLVFGLSPPLAASPGHNTPVPPPKPAPGLWVERSAAADLALVEIARRIGRHGGAALVVDYGYVGADRPGGPTLQAVRGHARADPLDAPGEADLTWLPDFDHLALLARAAAAVDAFVQPQGAFLAALGIGQRAQALAAARPDEAEPVADALERLVMADAMGARFKALAIVPRGAPAPPGFAPGLPVPSRS
ncbi:MAG: class I SAM-dependent methyltransferase [Paracoccaceae bacterium]